MSTMSTNYSRRLRWNGNVALLLPIVPYQACDSFHNCGTEVIPPLYLTLSLLGILGNLCSLWTCLKPSRPWSIGSIGVLNLALCDLAYLASVPPRALYLHANYDWTMGRSVCILCSVLHFVGLTSSTMFICAISVDRFLAIVFPLESRILRTPRNASLVSLMLWAITILLIYLSYPNIVYCEHQSGSRYCGAVVTSNYKSLGATYNLLSYYSVQVSVPLMLIIPSYVKIIAKMRQSRQQWAVGGGIQSHDKTMWLIGVYIANFLGCWIPGQFLHILACIIFFTVFDNHNRCSMSIVVNLLVEISQLLYCLNACLDPFIFHIQGGMLRKVLGCKACWWRKSVWRGKIKTPAVSVIKM